MRNDGSTRDMPDIHVHRWGGAALGAARSRARPAVALVFSIPGRGLLDGGLGGRLLRSTQAPNPTGKQPIEPARVGTAVAADEDEGGDPEQEEENKDREGAY